MPLTSRRDLSTIKSVNKLVTRRENIECQQSLIRTSMPGPALFSAMAWT